MEDSFSARAPVSGPYAEKDSGSLPGLGQRLARPDAATGFGARKRGRVQSEAATWPDRPGGRPTGRKRRFH